MNHGLRALVKLPLALVCVSLWPVSRARADDAIVTIYNHGSRWTTGLPGSNHGIFWGCVYDGDVRLNCFREQKVFSQIKFNRFLVLHVPAGPHVFAASYEKHPPKRSQLDVLLESGKHYYLRAQSESRGVIEIEFDYGRMDNMSCADAMQEMEKAKPLPDKLLSSEGRAKAVAGQAIPPCS